MVPGGLDLGLDLGVDLGLHLGLDLDVFASEYADACERFLQAATRAGARVRHWPHPLPGPRGEALAAVLPRETALLLHAVNPHGSAWGRRVTEETVDPNRKGVDFGQPLPGTAASQERTGLTEFGCERALAHADIAFVVLEFGAWGAPHAEHALRDDAWLWQHGNTRARGAADPPRQIAHYY